MGHPMGEAKHKKVKLRDAGLPCIYCGGRAAGTTEDHCPPRALFREKQWPEGFVFPACEPCNGGSSDEDLLVALLAHMAPDQDKKTQTTGTGLMRLIHRQQPYLLGQMMKMTAIEAKSAARRLNMKPEPGQTYQEMGIVNIPEEMHTAVGAFALKLTKAIYFKQTGNIFPAEGSVMYQWFTNAQMQEHGSIPMLDAFANVAAATSPIKRNGKDLSDQFDVKFSTASDAPLHVIQVIFGKMFGFVSILSEEPGRVEALHQRMVEKTGNEGPFTFLTSPTTA